MKPTALLLLAGIAICMLVIIFVPEPEPIPVPTAMGRSHDHVSSSSQPKISTDSVPSAASPGTEDVAELKITDQVAGDGKEAGAGKRVTVHYTGWLYDTKAADNKGLQFDSSRGGVPFLFVLGNGQVIRGWDEGVKGMKVGGKRVLIIPSQMGYGQQGSGQIPPNAALMFEVEVVRVE